MAAFAAGKTAAFLSAEGAELLDCDLEKLRMAHRMGVRIVNITWNHPNALSGTNAEEPDRGLSEQGRAFVKTMGELGMLVERLKELEFQGYQFEGAEATLEMLIRRQLGRYRPHFAVRNFKTIGEQQAGEEKAPASIREQKISVRAISNPASAEKGS